MEGQRSRDASTSHSSTAICTIAIDGTSHDLVGDIFTSISKIKP